MTGVLIVLAVLLAFVAIASTAVLIHDRIERWWNA